jgi:hypothetical protein
MVEQNFFDFRLGSHTPLYNSLLSLAHRRLLRRRLPMPDHAANPPIFHGVHRLLEVIRDLYDRPRFRLRRTGLGLADRPLPLIWLERAPDTEGFLTALSDQMGHATPPRVPHALVDAAEAQKEVRSRWEIPDNSDTGRIRQVPLLPLLDELSLRLSADKFGIGRLTRFEHYLLADWLTGQRLGPRTERSPETGVVQLLRSWTGMESRPIASPLTDAAELAPSVPTKVGLRLLEWVGRRVGFRLIRERIPGLGRETRWFMHRQPYMVPRLSRKFLGFAERLTVDRRQWEKEDEIKRLLVHAFLEDLRIAYRRRRCRVLPRRKGWQRTAYVTVLLDNVTTENGGWELLRLISEVRNETGELDPLLVVAASDERPPPTTISDEDPTGALEAWRKELPYRRQKIDDDAWYLSVRIPRRPNPLEGLDSRDKNAWLLRDTRVPRKPPLPARRGVAEATAVLMLSVVSLPMYDSLRDHWNANCSFFRSGITDAISVKPLEISRGDTQCVGYSDSIRQIFGSTPRLENAQRIVFEQNEIAEQKHNLQPRRPYISIVYFAALTHPELSVEDQSLAEDIEGLYLHQKENNDSKSPTYPLLRVIVANGGTEMKVAPQVAREMIVPLFESDPTAMGVLGLDRTVKETADAIEEFGIHGIPVVGNILAGSGLEERSPLYFQFIPDTTGEATLIDNYARSKKAPKVTIYHPPPGHDIYVRTLVEALGRLNKEKVEKIKDHSPGNRFDFQFDFQELNGTRKLDSTCSADRPADHSKEIIVYVGREAKFLDFLNGIADSCEDKTKAPQIVAPDTLFVTEELGQPHPKLQDLPISFLINGSPVVLAGKECRDSGIPAAPAIAINKNPLKSFCRIYHQFYDTNLKKFIRQSGPPWPGERTGLAYDAAELFITAVDKTPQKSGPNRAPHRAAVAQMFREWPVMPFKGTTGVIDLRKSRIGGQTLAILKIPDINIATNPTCEYLSLSVGIESQTRNNCP